MQFSFYLPCRLRIERTGLDSVGRIAAAYGRRAFVVLSPSLKDSFVTDKLGLSFEAAGVEFQTFCKPHGEPSPDMVRAALAQMRECGPQVVVAIGGGSVLDLAKAVSGMYFNGGEIKPYLEGVGDGRVMEHAPLPWIAFPTTGGTGAEVTRNAVISDAAEGYKKSFRDERLYAREVILDATLMTRVPRQASAECGMDAITQLIESYTSRKATPLTRAIALSGFGALKAERGNALTAVWQEPGNLEARERMAYAAMLSGVCLANSGLGAAHGFAAALGALYGIGHGRACAMMLPFVLSANLPACAEDYVAIHSLMNVGGGTLREDVLLLNRTFGIPSDLKALELDEEQARALIRASYGSSMSGNPIAYSEEEWYQLFLKYDLI